MENDKKHDNLIRIRECLNKKYKNILLYFGPKCTCMNCAFEHTDDLLSVRERKREKESDLLEIYIKM